MTEKPLGHKNYGSIPHLPGSRRGPGDHGCSEQQAEMALKLKSKRHTIIVQEKLDGSNVGVHRRGQELIPLGRSGWRAASSPHEQHMLFHNWVYDNYSRFMALLNDGERVVGEWLAMAHGTRYDLTNLEPFVAFDIMRGHERVLYDEFNHRIYGRFYKVPLLMYIDKYSYSPQAFINLAMAFLGKHGKYGAIDEAEGAVWRVEYNRPTGEKGESKKELLFLAKYVRPDKIDGKYFTEITGEDPVWNWRPT